MEANIPRANGSRPECVGDSACSVVLSQAERLGTLSDEFMILLLAYVE
jgi:hypothetical protein